MLGWDAETINMLYVYFGNNTSEVRQKALARVHVCAGDDGQVTHITSDMYTVGSLPDLTRGASLFSGKQVFLLDTPSERAEAYEDIMENLELLKDSEHDFVLIEHAILAGDKKKLSSYGEMHELVGEKKSIFNTFALTDALLVRDKKTLWLLLMDAWKAGVPNEEIVGILFWQVKILRLVEKTKSAEEAGQKPFVYQKAKRALIKFKSGELERLSRELLVLYHEGHMGKADMSLALEKWVLTV
jgi:DNA polymerase III delta subunit